MFCAVGNDVFKTSAALPPWSYRRVGQTHLRWDLVTGQISISGRGWQVKESGTGGAGAGVVDADWIKNDRFAFMQLSHRVSHLLSPLRRATPVRRAYHVYRCLDMYVYVELDLCWHGLWKIYEIDSPWCFRVLTNSVLRYLQEIEIIECHIFSNDGFMVKSVPL